MNKLSSKISTWILENNPESTKEYDELVYILQCFFERLISYGVLFTIAFIINMPLQALIWTAFYSVLRFHIGGSHSETYVGCLIIGTTFTILCVLAVPFLANYSFLLIVEVLFSIIVAFKIKPVVHPNKYISEKNLTNKNRNAKILVLIETGIVFLFYFLLDSWVAQSAAMGMCTASILCIVGKFSYKNKV